MHWPTHEVSNQPPLLADVNLFDADLALQTAAMDALGPSEIGTLRELGRWAGSSEAQTLAWRANRFPPELRTHDRQGHRIDQTEFDPAWHTLLAKLRAGGLHGRAWRGLSRNAHFARAAAFFLHAQVEAGSLCPVTMTCAAVPVLQREPLFAALADKLFSETYDARDLPITAKPAILVGMGLTEKQGGSDLRGTQTEAVPLDRGGRGTVYLLTGHKWFFSAPMCDAHLVLAAAPEGLSAFFVPRWRADGRRNTVLLQRLKDKLGNRSNASAEAEFAEAHGILVGEPGRGIATLAEMASLTRLDCAIASAALMRQALTQVLHHARHRMAFGRPLAQQPLMMSVLADLALESEAALLLVLRLAQALDRGEMTWLRVMTPAAKFWICKRALEFSGECMEILGGNGYIEDGPLARLYREAPLNSIWEGSGNVMCLDLLRAMRQAGAAWHEVLDWLRTATLADGRLQPLFEALEVGLGLPLDQQQQQARRITQSLVLLAQATLLLEQAPEEVADAFIASRCDLQHGRVYGALPARDWSRLIARAWQN